MPKITKALFTKPRYDADANPLTQRVQGFFLGKANVRTAIVPQKYRIAQNG